MKRGKTFALSLLHLAGAATACSPSDEGHCAPPPETKRLETGAYAGKGEVPYATGVSSFPHKGGVNQELSFDRAAGNVRVSYLRDGKMVVENWKVKSIQERP